jgi:myosin-6
MSYYKKMRDDEGFIIRHFAGAVCYQADGFMDKNNDALQPDAQDMIDQSKDPFCVNLYKGVVRPKKGKMALISLGNKFKKALAELMTKLESTRSTFIRCIKPNQEKQPKLFKGGEILSQLQCAGMVSVLDLMQGGFPSRTAFKDLYDMYASILPPVLKALDPRTFAQALFKALGLSEDDFQFGVSKVFFRPGKFAEFDTIMKADPENLKQLVGKVIAWLVKQRWKKISWSVVSCLKFAAKIRSRAGAIVLMQSVVRMYITSSVNVARYKAVKQLRVMYGSIPALEEGIQKLKSKDKLQGEIEKVRDEIAGSIKNVKSSDATTREEISAMTDKIQAMVDKVVSKTQKAMAKEKLAAEAEALKKKAEEMEKARLQKLKEEEERKAREANLDNEKAMAAEQKIADAQAEKDQEAALIAAEKEKNSSKAQGKLAAERKAEMEEEAILEQERRDQELAMRLAMDEGEGADGALSDEARKVAKAGAGQQKRRRSVNRNKQQFMSKKQAALHKKHDLSRWKYADLRDTINTSVDVELLEACREEFHRRLKVYHAWKTKNNNKKSRPGSTRAPSEVHAAAASRSSAPQPKKKKKASSRPQRFFRIPFMRADGKATEKKKGWWFAHFDGQWIARQMELHPDKPPVLLKAGVNDMEMCELSLDETGLARKRGAEILAREFEEEWTKCGGKPYSRAAKK